MQTDFVEPRWISYLNALSTAAVAFFALVALWRDSRDRNQRSLAAGTKISVVADALHKVLKDWRKEVPIDVIFADREATEQDRATIVMWVGDLVEQFPSVEAQALELAREGVMGDRATAAAASAAATTVLHMMHIARRQPLIRGVNPQGARQVGRRVESALRETEDLLEHVAHRTRQRRLYQPKS